jgi:hypothetical protein
VAITGNRPPQLYFTWLSSSFTELLPSHQKKQGRKAALEDGTAGEGPAAHNVHCECG